MRACLLLVLASGCAAVPPEEPAAYCRNVAVVEETSRAVMVSSHGPLEHGRALFGKTWEKHSLRARIDQPSGVARYELLAAISYVAPKAKHFDAAQVETPAGARSALPRTILDAQDCGEYRSGLVCTQIQHVVLDVSEGLLRAVAGGKLPERSWHVEFQDSGGDKYFVLVPIAEVEGLLDAVDVRLGRRQACATPAAAAQ